jgi:hypothetical protein
VSEGVGHDENSIASPVQSGDIQAHDVLFVGDADADRSGWRLLGTVSGLSGIPIRDKPPEVIRALTAAAEVKFWLIRRANRDGHVLGTIEIAAAGGCMLAQDTDERREIFGPEGEAVVYFRDAKKRERARRVCDSSERKRLAAGLHRCIAGGAHTYAHWLATMLGVPIGR